MMSLVDALQVSPARHRRRKKIGPSPMALYSPKMSGGVRVEVFLLDGRKLEFSVGVRLLTQELMALVTSHFSLRESHFFALAFRDSTGHYHWLLDDRRLLDHDFARGVRTLPLHFLVRFYPESVTSELRDAQTVELFYQQARNAISKGAIELETSTATCLAALSLQISIGDFISESISKNYLRKSSFQTYFEPLEHSELQLCEDSVCSEHQQLSGISRGDAVLSYMRQVERLPCYGVHFYEVRDRSNTSWYLGISQKGISQYDYLDKRKPNRVFFWKQLENLYFRERKFSIEVHDPKRVVLALNSFNLYEGAFFEPHLEDDLLQAITEDTTQVSVSRRTFGPGNVSVYVWFSESQSLCKSIWSMAIAQHQFYLDRKTSRLKEGSSNPPDLVGDLSRSCISLSTHSSSPNLSRSGSHSSLQHTSHTEDSASTESLHAARMEMVSALQQRYETLQEKLDEKTEELRLLCLREGELTGELPPEYPTKSGEPPPVVRKRVGTSFMLDEALINKIINKQEETVASLELEYEIQAKIVSAALRLANECSMKKGLRKQRKHSYHQATQRLRDIEHRLKQAKSRQAQVIANNASTMPKMKKKPRPVSDSEGTQDDGCVGLKETSFIDGVSLSPNPCPPLQAQVPKLKGGHISLHSAPPSPQRSGGGTPSEASKSSRSDSPARPSSGYIPSVVYTRSQYRAQHYPTLSTRGQSVPCESLSHQRSFNGGLYNLPQQRTSIASHSLDDLEASTGSTPVVIKPSSTPSASHLPPHPNSPINYQYTPHHHHFKHHYYPHHNLYHHHHNVRRQKSGSGESQSERFGSLDRRKASSGKFESRSLEHLDTLPHFPPQPQNQGYDYGMQGVNGTPPYIQEPLEGHTFPTDQSFALDVVDGVLLTESQPVNGVSQEGFLPLPGGNISPERKTSSSGVSRSNSGRSNFMSGVETSYNGTPGTTHRGAYPLAGETLRGDSSFSSYPSNQENIPPLSTLDGPEVIIPLRVSNPPAHRGYSKREGYATSLRPTASVNAADHLRPFRICSNEPPELRSTKSSSELPPLKPTNLRIREPSPTAASTPPYPNRCVEKPPGKTRHLSLKDGDSRESPNFAHHRNSERTPNGNCDESPLISLAEAARLRKEQREREMFEGSEPARESKLHPHPSTNSLHNVSTSSIGSSESGGSVFHSPNEGSDSLNSTLNSTSLNATLTVISTGSYQPSREISKPFEMADFYKYSTKFRRKSSSSGSQESPLSPSLPPRSSQLVMNVTNNVNNSLPPPPSPTLIAQQSSPAPQQKGLYQPLTPLTCKPLEDGSNDSEGTPQPPGSEILIHQRQKGAWEHTPIHQAVPVNVTTKRSATLV